MKIAKALPPNYDAIAKAFDLAEAHEHGVVFTYGDTIYNPSGNELPENLIVHEQTHETQQSEYEGGPAAWWDRYLTDAPFRTEQELEAYGRQYAFMLKVGYSSKTMTYVLSQLGYALASPMYGSLMTWPVAESKIRNAAKHHSTV